MRFSIDAACGCDMGKIRKNNEDNFFFNNMCLEQDNQGLDDIACFCDTLKNGFRIAVFDGMGGERFGEVASFVAAKKMQSITGTLTDVFTSKDKLLTKLTMQLNDAVVEKKKELRTEHCGTTMVALYYSSGYVYSCNAGDSRAYRLRDGELLQMSVDHADKYYRGRHKKAPLTQYLGIDPEEMLIEPHIAKDKICKGDVYLLCSDGLTDMLTDCEISDIIQTSKNAEDCVQKLIMAALEHGGRDNITVIVCRMD